MKLTKMEEMGSLRTKSLGGENGAYQYIRVPDTSAREHSANSSDHNNLIQSQYLAVQRVPDIVNATKNFTTLLNGNEFLIDAHGDLMSGTTLERYIPQEYEGDLIHDDLTDDDRRLAAALVAVQLVNQQKQQTGTHILPLLSAPSLQVGGAKAESGDEVTTVQMPQLSGPNKVDVTSSGSAGLATATTTQAVPSFIQASTGSQVLSNNVLHPLPPLKKVLSRNKFVRQDPEVAVSQVPLESLGIHQEMDTIDVEIGNTEVIKTQDMEFMMPEDGKEGFDSEEETEGADSDYDLTDDNKRNILPHKKRIARRLRHPKKTASVRAGRPDVVTRASNQTECTQTAALRFSCDICFDSFNNQWKFFEHLKTHYEPAQTHHNQSRRSAQMSKLGTQTKEASTGARQGRTPPSKVKFMPSLSPLSPPSPLPSHRGPLNSPRPNVVIEKGATKNVTEPKRNKPPVVLRNATTSTRPVKHKGAGHAESQPSNRSSSVGGQLQDIMVSTPSLLELELQNSVVQTLWECQPCKRVFKRQKTFESHMALNHQKEEPIEEFSDTEDMMAGIKVFVISDEEKDNGQNPVMREVAIQKEWYEEDGLPVDDFAASDDASKQLSDLKVEVKFESDVDLGIHLSEKAMNDVEDLNNADISQQQQTVKTTGAKNQQGKDSDDRKGCELCNLQFKTKKELNTHISQAHTEIMDAITKTVRRQGDGTAKKGNLICKECGRRFHHRNSLLYHVRNHNGERGYQCEVCGKGFFAKSALKVHMRQHSGVKPFKCEFCSRCFRQWGDLKYHVISIHSDQRNYQCEFCGKDFARKYSLTVHSRIHTGERNYKCEFCGKSFRAASYLQNHRRIHTGEKPHACEICGKPFRVRSDMKRHLFTHKDVPFVKTKAEPKESPADSTDPKFSSGVTEVTNQTSEHHLPMSDMAKVEELEVSTVEGILSEETVQATSRLQEELTSPFIPREGLDAQREGNTLYFWQVFPT